ncbi:hypothetical protein [Kitasatospora purpeofusca]|uniref:hypothetical protein n=1 Tax=Kitasatospora purpeofusca TaxID=67352 RepID=UPI002A5A3967|nr:hypothetical protein [Kitasatospora purpeofusca]MDY0813939.1 hypothetical protein [Kitasatospora purpeofusca]
MPYACPLPGTLLRRPLLRVHQTAPAAQSPQWPDPRDGHGDSDSNGDGRRVVRVVKARLFDGP